MTSQPNRLQGLTLAPKGMFAPVDSDRMRSRRNQTLLPAYIVFTALTIWVLIFSGGLVTSKGVGLSVPDWPTSYGYNMFAFPVSRWVGGVFYEHSHRLLASAVGFMTIILTAWIWLKDERRWLGWLGTAALAAVILQGVLGGLRVVWLKDQIGIFHACLAQAFLALVSFLALATSGWWVRLASQPIGARQAQTARRISWMFFGVAGLIYLQLVLGATMRHAHAGLSIRDFPLAYGHLWPATNSTDISSINQEREALGLPVTTAGLILLQMFHRVGAFAITVAVMVSIVAVWRASADLPGSVRRLAMVGPFLIVIQITLGVYTIWTNKAADIATSHVAIGAASLVWAVLTCASSRRYAQSPPATLKTASYDEAEQPRVYLPELVRA